MCNSLKKCVVTVFLLCGWVLVATGSQAVEKKEVVFYQTDVSEAGSFAYLRDSVRLMLASRIAPIAGGEIRLENAMQKKRDFASYRIMSRVASTKNGIELSVKAFRPSEENSLQFQSVAKDNKEILAALDVLVGDLGKLLFQVEEPEKVSNKTGKKEGSDIDAGAMHPDRLYKSTSGFGLSISQDEFISQTELEVKATERYKSAIVSAQSKGMTAGDIDGDGLDEIVIATNTKLYIYQIRDKKIEQLDTISLPGELQVHAVNVADLNNNGVMEIYVSSIRHKEARSFVLEWDPTNGTKWLYENVYWYLRPLVIPGEGLVLAGQQSGFSGATMTSGIFRLTIHQGEKILKGEQLMLPGSANLFDFVFADLDGDKLSEIVTINRKEQMQVYSSDLQLLYTSPSGFGGRELLEEYTAPIRLVVTDFDNNGKNDILLVDNELYSPKMFKKTRLYRNGQVRGLGWDDGFVEMWHTNLFSKGIVDFQFFAAPQEDGSVQGRLFVVEPEDATLLENIFLGMGGSRLSVFGMSFISKK